MSLVLFGLKNDKSLRTAVDEFTCNELIHRNSAGVLQLAALRQANIRRGGLRHDNGAETKRGHDSYCRSLLTHTQDIYHSYP